MSSKEIRVGIIGNPNVGKTFESFLGLNYYTIFN